MYKVFINPKVIFLTDSLNKLNDTSDFCYLKYESDNTVSSALDLLKMEETNKVCIIHKDEEFLFTQFKSNFKYIEAAGGFVRNRQNEILFIKRLGTWDLPKGKIDFGEDKFMAAVREVEEECGIKNLKITKELTPTYHIYEHKNKSILKKTYWFVMEAMSENNKLVPQLEENITEVKWMKEEEALEAIENTYETIKDVVKEGLS